MDAGTDLFQAQLFLDDEWIADSAFVTRRWHQPLKYPEPVLRAKHAWERGCPVVYGTILHLGGKFHMWYCTWTRHPLPLVCYAESADGVVWEKPNLGLHEFGGSRHNNIVLRSVHPHGYIDDITVIPDPGDTEWPFKALYWDSGQEKESGPVGIRAARSKDGLKWDTSPGLVLPGWGDRFNAMSERIDGQYVVFGRAPCGSPKGRTVWLTYSPDLIHWTDPVLVLAPDIEDPPHMQYYSLVAFRYAGLMLGSIERMHMSPDKLDPELVFSRDNGSTWQHARQRPTFIPWGPAGAWDSDWINLPTNAPIHHGKRLFFYYSGRSGAHGVPYPLNHGAIGLALLRIDGFASLQAAEKEGYVVTPPVKWVAGEVCVNCDTRRDLAAHPGYDVGSVVVEVLDPDLNPIPGFSRAECLGVHHNTVDLEGAAAIVRWKDNRSLASLAGRPVRLRFWLRDAHLYSFHAGQVHKR